MNWELRQVEDIEATLDDSGVYVIIHRINSEPLRPNFGKSQVRLDLMKSLENEHHEAIVSFQGTANNVRKAVIHWLQIWGVTDPANVHLISLGHASYIGYELLRAETDPNYVQG